MLSFAQNKRLHEKKSTTAKLSKMSKPGTKELQWEKNVSLKLTALMCQEKWQENLKKNQGKQHLSKTSQSSSLQTRYYWTID